MVTHRLTIIVAPLRLVTSMSHLTDATNHFRGHLTRHLFYLFVTPNTKHCTISNTLTRIVLLRFISSDSACGLPPTDKLAARPKTFQYEWNGCRDPVTSRSSHTSMMTERESLRQWKAGDY